MREQDTKELNSYFCTLGTHNTFGMSGGRGFISLIVMAEKENIVFEEWLDTIPLKFTKRDIKKHRPVFDFENYTIYMQCESDLRYLKKCIKMAKVSLNTINLTLRYSVEAVEREGIREIIAAIDNPKS